MKKLFKVLREYYDKLSVLLFIIAFLLLVLTLWTALFYFLADVFLYDFTEPITGYYKLGIIFLILLIFTHNFFYSIMYTDNISSKITNWIDSHSTQLLVWLSFGLANTILLDLCYYRFKYHKYNLLQYRTNVIDSNLAKFPILNIPIYCLFIRTLQKKMPLPPIKELTGLYLRGQLMTYIIRNTDCAEIGPF